MPDKHKQTAGRFGGVFEKPDPKAAHMARRQSQGLTVREVAKDFGVSKSTAHRKVKAHSMRDGFNRIGSAND